MEQALKDRLVGAVVLVGMAVLLIPELLSGRKPTISSDDTADGARTYTIELQPPRSRLPADAAPGPEQPGPSRSAALTLPAPIDDARDEAVADTSAKTAVEPTGGLTDKIDVDGATDTVAERRPPEPVRDSAPSSAPADTSAASAAEVTGGLAVQVGAFGSEDAANRLVRELQSKGFDAYLSPVERGDKTLQRVRVGPARDAATAAATAERLKQLGYGSAVVVGS